MDTSVIIIQHFLIRPELNIVAYAVKTLYRRRWPFYPAGEATVVTITTQDMQRALIYERVCYGGVTLKQYNMEMFVWMTMLSIISAGK